MDPDPFVVATKLLERRSFIGTGKQFNVIAASWIQFMVHDWIDHLESTHQVSFLSFFPLKDIYGDKFVEDFFNKGVLSMYLSKLKYPSRV